MHLPCIQFSKNNTGFCPEPKAQRRKRHTLAALFLKPWSFILFRLNPSNVLGGGERDRTDDLLRARQALSQLSYTPNSTADLRMRNADLTPNFCPSFRNPNSNIRLQFGGPSWN
jgi:hypothetical protein